MIHRLAIFALLLPGVATSWELVDTSKRVGPSKGDFSLQLPGDWLCDISHHSLEASHDGPGLNHVSIAIPSHKAAFKNSKKVSTPASTPEDLAEYYIAEVQTGPTAVRSLEVLSNEPTELAGKPAFRVHLRYRAADTAGGAVMESVAIGTALKNGVLLATFEAPSIHYFERWVGEFDAAAETLSLTPAPK